jgi:two-component system phosphate regulon sensor histidine kinase PhoR
MSLPDPPRPPYASPWRTLGLAVAGAAAAIALALCGQAAPLPALIAAVGVAAGAALLRPRRPGRPAAVATPAQPAFEPPPKPPFTPPFAAMLDRLTDPILLIQGGARDDASGRRFVFANAAARSLLRIQRQEGPLSTAIRAPEVLDAVDEALYDGIAGEAVYETRGVQDRFWRARALPLAAESASPLLALLALRDETEVRRSERTRADFLANASHELRTPLASLTGFIETLRGHAREDPEARERFLAIMHTQAERMRRLIDDLMSLSRIEQGEHIPPSGSVDMAVAVTDVLDALAPLAKERCITFAPRLPPAGQAVVSADRDQILQVIQNLAENAIKYTPSGGCVAIEVSADLTPARAAAPVSDFAAHFSILTPDHAAGQRYAAVRVRDSGPGIARGHLPRLTERFYRVEGQKVRQRPGTGLGLAIVKHIVNRHRGGLIVESTEGVGAMFTAYIPMALMPMAQAAMVPGPPAPAGTPPRQAPVEPQPGGAGEGNVAGA